MDKFTYCHKERVRRALLQQVKATATPNPEQPNVTSDSSSVPDKPAELSNGSVKHDKDPLELIKNTQMERSQQVKDR